MQRVAGAAAGAAADADAAAAAAALVAPLMQLLSDVAGAIRRLRNARAVELSERALAAAEALPLPRDSLVVARCMSYLVDTRTRPNISVLAAADAAQQSEMC